MCFYQFFEVEFCYNQNTGNIPDLRWSCWINDRINFYFSDTYYEIAKKMQICLRNERTFASKMKTVFEIDEKLQIS